MNFEFVDRWLLCLHSSIASKTTELKPPTARIFYRDTFPNPLMYASAFILYTYRPNEPVCFGQFSKFIIHERSNDKCGLSVDYGLEFAFGIRFKPIRSGLNWLEDASNSIANLQTHEQTHQLKPISATSIHLVNNKQRRLCGTAYTASDVASQSCWGNWCSFFLAADQFELGEIVIIVVSKWHFAYSLVEFGTMRFMWDTIYISSECTTMMAIIYLGPPEYQWLA